MLISPAAARSVSRAASAHSTERWSGRNVRVKVAFGGGTSDDGALGGKAGFLWFEVEAPKDEGL